jgi:hypothetical protein
MGASMRLDAPTEKTPAGSGGMLVAEAMMETCLFGSSGQYKHHRSIFPESCRRTESRNQEKMPISPPEDELRRAIIDLKSQNPSLGISKVHAYLLAMYPHWTVSEKRTRKILQAEGLTLITPSHSGAFPQPNYDPSVSVFPASRVIPHLDTRRWSPRVAVRYIDNKKGKGLVATEDIAQGETLWREDPFVIAPEW